MKKVIFSWENLHSELYILLDIFKMYICTFQIAYTMQLKIEGKTYHAESNTKKAAKQGWTIWPIILYTFEIFFSSVCCRGLELHSSHTPMMAVAILSLA